MYLLFLRFGFYMILVFAELICRFRFMNELCICDRRCDCTLSRLLWWLEGLDVFRWGSVSSCFFV